MIIERQSTQIYLDFGDGDIGSFATNDFIDGTKRVAMWFYQCEKGEVGRMLTTKSEDVSHFPVIMAFHKKESLETVIKNLTDLLGSFDGDQEVE